jgi:hypothetical protein
MATGAFVPLAPSIRELAARSELLNDQSVPFEINAVIQAVEPVVVSVSVVASDGMGAAAVFRNAYTSSPDVLILEPAIFQTICQPTNADHRRRMEAAHNHPMGDIVQAAVETDCVFNSKGNAGVLERWFAEFPDAGIAVNESGDRKAMIFKCLSSYRAAVFMTDRPEMAGGARELGTMVLR